MHAQVIQLGHGNTYPRILGDADADADVTYAATSNPNDPAGTNPINTTSQNLPGCGNDETITLTRGTEVSCDLCHENELN